MQEIDFEQLQDVETEKALLGGLMFCGADKLAEMVAGKISLADFSSEKNKLIFRAVLALFEKGLKPDASALAVQLQAGGKIDKVESVTLVGELMQKAGASLPFLADRLHKLAERRRLALVLGECKALLLQDELTAEKALEMLTGAISQQEKGGLVSVRDALVGGVVDSLLSGELLQGLKTGFDELDALTGGFHKGQLVLLAARPAMGKSAFASNIALNVLKDGGRVAFFSLEMTEQAILSRMVSEVSGLDLRKRDGATEDAIFSACDWLFQQELKVQDASASRLSVASIRLELLRQRARGWCPDLVVIDYLGLLKPDGGRASAYEQITEISKALKLLAVEMAAPFLVLAQLNRGAEGRDDKRPRMSDLRDSGGLEQDADIILGLFREGYYTKDARDKTAELHVLKVRDGGRVGAIPLLFEGAKTTFIGLPAGRWEKAGGEWVEAGAVQAARRMKKA